MAHCRGGAGRTGIRGTSSSRNGPDRSVTDVARKVAERVGWGGLSRPAMLNASISEADDGSSGEAMMDISLEDV